MKYKRVNKRELRALGIAASVFALVFVVSLFDGGREILLKIGSPAFSLGTHITDSFQSLGNALRTKNSLVHTIEELRQENMILAHDSFAYRILRAENRALRERLGIWQGESGHILARVVARPPVVPFDSLTIETAHRGVVPIGSRVRISETIEIGRIETWGSRTGIVALYTSTGTRTPVEINAGGSLVVAEGVGGGSYILRVPRSFPVEVGDLLTRPGLESVVIGIVESVSAQEADPFLFVRARLPINLFEITWVYVKKSNGSPQESAPWF